MAVHAIIFDLDGVIVSTDNYHYLGWKAMADEAGIYFDRAINERLRGVSRMESLAIILEKATRDYSDEEKQAMAARKNDIYRQSLQDLSPEEILPGAMDILQECKTRGIEVAVGSSSKNTPLILDRIGLGDFFDAVADGNQISKSKPDPEVFLLAARKIGMDPAVCLVVEDALAGVEAALAGGMKALAVGYASRDDRAHLQAESLAAVTLDQLLEL